MLSREIQPQSSTPFTVEGLEQFNRPQSSPPAPPAPQERNRGRGFRRAGNACEIAAGASLNSAIIFLFHLLQVHPLAFLVALGCSHFYFIATAFGEGGDRLVANAMTGVSAGVAGISALSEPIGEWLEAQQSRDAAVAKLQDLYADQPPSSPLSSWGLILIAVLSVLFLSIGGQQKRR